MFRIFLKLGLLFSLFLLSNIESRAGGAMPVPGACCNCDNECDGGSSGVCGDSFTEARCESVENGMFQGSGTICTDDPCVAPTPTPTPTPAPFDVEKVYRQTDVCFEENNDGDVDGEGLQIISEDCVETEGDACASNADCATSNLCINNICQVDNDTDGAINEDCTECEGNSSPGTLLPMIGNVFQLEPVLKRNGRVASYNPGQYYAVSTVTTLEELNNLWIIEDYDMCTNDDPAISKLNPKPGKGGGNVLLVLEEDGEFIEVLNSKADEIEINTDPDSASVHLEDVPNGSILHVYVKFKPGLKNDFLPSFPDNMCMNFNSAFTGAFEPTPLCPGASNCCVDQGEAMGCDDAVCESLICGNISSNCCNSEWNEGCADLADEYCVVESFCPSASNCCTDRPGETGCNNVFCEEEVCSFQSRCCSIGWDSICVELASSLCAGLPEGETAKASLIVGDGPPWLPAACNNIGESCNLSECGGKGGCFELDASVPNGGLGICAFIDGVIAACTTQADCSLGSFCIDAGGCVPPVFMCPDLS